CADISISDVVVSPDAGMSIDSGVSVDAATTSVDTGTSGHDAATTTTRPPQACACSAPGRRANGSWAALGLAGIAALIARRRSRSFGRDIAGVTDRAVTAAE